MDAILTMHSIDDSRSVLSLAADDLARLVDGLLAQDVHITSMEDLAHAPARAGALRAVLTFDDGMESVHRIARPILESRGVTATTYIVTNWVGRDNRWPTQPPHAPHFPLMSWSQIEELCDAGWEIGSHGQDHVPYSHMPAEQWISELEGSKRTLEDRLQRKVRHLAYPYGIACAEAERRAAAHYASATSTDMGYVQASSNRLRLPRIDSYYLRDWHGRAPVFGTRSRTHLRWRAFLRGIRRRGMTS